MKARDHYQQHTGGTAQCNIVVCDDGIMAFLKDNFAAAEMLWETIEATHGKVFKLSKLLQNVPRPSRRHLKGLRSHSIYEVFHRMLFYYHYQIGFVARSTVDRRGKFKKASNLNSHLRLVWGADQSVEEDDGASVGGGMTFEKALYDGSHNSDGSRYVMFGNNIAIGHLMIVNDADARMAESVIIKTVPEFLNDKSLGFTQHATKVRTTKLRRVVTNLPAAAADGGGRVWNHHHLCQHHQHCSRTFLPSLAIFLCLIDRPWTTNEENPSTSTCFLPIPMPCIKVTFS
jgi:cellulose synthase/poly-beta-1,6-N-acetylglucosamine synthase-like glycosyltransferase